MNHDSDDAITAVPTRYAEQISVADFEREALEFTEQEVKRLNAAVRLQPKLGARSDFFQDVKNVAKGLPLFLGKHTRFIYDEQDDIVAAVDVTQEALNRGPLVRTVVESEEVYCDDEDDEDITYFFAKQNEKMDVSIAEVDIKMDVGIAEVDTIMEDVEMNMAAVTID
ncbi:hypothetical protein CCR75_007984 [Bremia lactucae]|uniref:Uncharacterized protein n=1 Tax=Bremia lactucae TaxID=4779 RepID=A0A976FJA4_BRELC|nr:hypothetical protein CCR75_007984 [Bremia lactucae]